MNLQPLHFYAEPITVEFDTPPTLSKSPPCPDRFIWRDETHTIAAQLDTWRDFRRRGRMARNMRPSNLAKAQQRGSWGVGRFYFRVRTAADRIFDLYYDRAPTSADDRAGSWVLYREFAAPDDEPTASDATGDRGDDDG